MSSGYQEASTKGIGKYKKSSKKEVGIKALKTELKDQQTERAVLGCCINHWRQLPSVFEALTPDDFTYPPHRKIFSAMRTMFFVQTPVNMATVASEVPNCAYDISLCSDLACTDESLPHLCSKLSSLEKKRKYKAHLEKQLLHLQEKDIDELLATASSFSLTNTNTSVEALSSSSQLGKEFLEDLDNLKEGNVPLRRFTTPWKSLNSIIKGVMPAEYVVVGARPGIGKSAFAIGYSMHIGRKSTSLFMSFEMTKRQIIRRMTADLSGIEHDKLLEGSLSNKELERVVDSYQRLPENMYVIDSMDMSIERMYSFCCAFKEKHGLDAIFVDYLQLIRSQKTQLSREQEVAHISWMLKKLAKRLDVCVFALSQLKRPESKDKDRKPRLEDLRESGSLEQDADKVIFLWRSGLDQGKKGSDYTEFYTAKNRHGDCGIAKLSFNGSLQRFTDKPEDVL